MWNEGGGYGQYCPLSMAAEVLATRWTFLVLRELLEGSTHFNDIARGVPSMSRSLLASRLKDLTAAGLVRRTEHGPGRPVDYTLSPAGQALGPVVFSLARWGQEWIDTVPSLRAADTDFLMWDMHRNIRILPEMPDPFIIAFHFPDAPNGKPDHWIVIKDRKPSVGFSDPHLDHTVYVQATLDDMVQVWMGWLDLETARLDGRLLIEGPAEWCENPKRWLGLSGVSGTAKRPKGERILTED